MIKGLHTAIITPFDKNNLFDESRFRELVERQIKAGAQGVVPMGTTGESPTLNEKEHLRVIELAVQAADGRLEVVAGTGSNCTREAIERTKNAEKLGISASLQVAPYYNKPSQEGFYQHFKAIAEACPNLPIVLYNVPGRAGKNIEVDTILRLTKIPNIVAIKEASGDIDQIREICEKKPKDFVVLSGDDGLTLEFVKVGCEGLISVASNVFPSEMVKFVAFLNEGKFDEAQKIQDKYTDFFDACFLENNPCAIKAMMEMKGLCSERVRLPLVPISEKNKEIMRNVLAKIND